MDFAEKINQALHNRGVGADARYDTVVSVLQTGTCDALPGAVVEEIKELLSGAGVCKEELCQVLFMYFGNKHFKKELDQFYTPITICLFISGMMIPGRTAIDPACGTGDLIRGYDGVRTLCDTSKEALELTTFSYGGGRGVEIVCCDSLDSWSQQDRVFDYCVMNPPFGNKTIIADDGVLSRYELGRGRKKQEVGILFVELGLKLLAPRGVLIAIVPNGYLGNSGEVFVRLRQMIVRRHRLIAVIQLPDSAFARSGTGVSTSILIVQKQAPHHPEYKVFVAATKNIGYVLNKKNTPIKYRKGTSIVDNDLVIVSRALRSFLSDNKVNDLNSGTHHEHENLNTTELGEECVLDVKRYLSGYRRVLARSLKKNYKQVKDYALTAPNFTKKTGHRCRYIDISSVSPPLYKATAYEAEDLPSRAKFRVFKGDIIVSRLKGTISFAVITEEADDLVVSNGFSVLRPINDDARTILFANLFKDAFRTQHQSLVTGSIMETITDDKVFSIHLEPLSKEDHLKFSRLLESVQTLNNELLRIASHTHTS